MIKKETVDRIIDTAQIEEVVGDFVQLKKRGANLLGVCPFHNEKTPSFTVSPAKGIYKCFGCGKAGNSVQFIMDHEKATFPEALRYLAAKYNIEIEEEVSENFNQEEHDKRESLLVISDFAKKYFADTLWNNDEGKSIGLSYFKERGFREDVIKKFDLGYSLNEWDGLTKTATVQGYKGEFLEETGLSIRNEEKNSLYDRFRGRVMFPVHNLTGRVIAFGGRILKTDPKSPKYVNSPESEIYHKSNVLYGAYFAKKAIREFDNCFLVEGYTDVISLHQSGIENVVASSGTSLTTEQIKLISRFTKNITILYDGDAAGIKASLRGMDMILEEGLNVKIVLFPEGQDPDSYVREVGGTSFKGYIHKNEKDFILFKTNLLLEEVKNDPIKKAGLIREIVETIAKIPDQITAALFIKECSVLMEMEERVLLSEYNKIRIKKYKKENLQEDIQLPEPDLGDVIQKPTYTESDEHQERDVIRLLLNYGSKQNWDKENPELTVADFIVEHLDNIEFQNQAYRDIISIYKSILNDNMIPEEKVFVNHEQKNIRDIAAALLSTPYSLSENWEKKHGIYVTNELELLKNSVHNSLNHLQMRKVMRMIDENKQHLREAKTEEEQLKYQQVHVHLTNLKIELSKQLGAVVLK
jgi:DNA primase